MIFSLPNLLVKKLPNRKNNMCTSPTETMIPIIQAFKEKFLNPK